MSLSKIVLSERVIECCRWHAQTMPEKNIQRYVKRGHDQIMIRRQTFIGKLGEFGAYAFVKKYHDETAVPPELNWSDDSDHFFNPDFFGDFYRYHVKTQETESAEKFKRSWMFQIKDPVTFNPTEKDKIILTEVLTDDEAHFSVRIHYFLEATSVLNLYRKPVKKNLKSKRCLYDGHLRQINNPI